MTYNEKYIIWISGYGGLEYTGLEASTKEEAEAICEKYNKQEASPYYEYVYTERAS